MRELTSTETEHAAGGVGPAATLGLGLVVAYVYEKAGGAKGIEEKVKAAITALAESDQSSTCKKSPAACLG